MKFSVRIILFLGNGGIAEYVTILISVTIAGFMNMNWFLLRLKLQLTQFHPIHQ